MKANRQIVPLFLVLSILLASLASKAQPFSTCFTAKQDSLRTLNGGLPQYQLATNQFQYWFNSQITERTVTVKADFSPSDPTAASPIAMNVFTGSCAAPVLLGSDILNPMDSVLEVPLSNLQLGDSLFVLLEFSPQPFPANFGFAFLTLVHHTSIVCASGGMQTMGNNTFKQQGLCGTANNFEVNNVAGLPPGCKFVSVVPGLEHNVALADNGEVWTWGGNTFGQLGDGNSGAGNDLDCPVKVVGLCDIVEVAAGECYSAAVDRNGVVYSWGSLNCQVGSIFTSPQVVAGLSNIASISGGGQFIAALDNNGVVSTAPASFPFSPSILNPMTNTMQISAGQLHVMALDSVGRVWVWGDNSAGQLGRGNVATTDVPTQPTGLSNITMKDIAAGPSFCLALRTNDWMYNFGSNQRRELAICQTQGTNFNMPQLVTKLTALPPANLPVRDLVAFSSHNHAWAILQGGTMRMWGNNGNNQLGDGSAGSTVCNPNTPGPSFPLCSVEPNSRPNLNFAFTLTGNGDTTICEPDTICLRASVAPKGGTFSWSTGSTADTTKVIVTTDTCITVTYTFCGRSATDTIKVRISDLQASYVNPVFAFCSGSGGVQIDSIPVTGGCPPYIYSWNPGSFLSCSTCPNPFANPPTTMQYVVTVIDAKGCMADDTVTVRIDTLATPIINGQPFDCSLDSLYVVANADPGATYTWSAPNASSINPTTGLFSHIQWPPGGGDTVFVIATKGACVDTGFYVVPRCCTRGPNPPIINESASNYFGGLPPFGATGQVFSVNGTFTIDANTNFAACTFWMGQGADIQIDPGVTLTMDACTLRACIDAMWNGIHINTQTARLDFRNGLIREAENAVVSHSGGDYFIQSSELRNNFKGVVVNPFSGAHPGTFNMVRIRKTLQPLLFPHAGQDANAGVEVNQVGVPILLQGLDIETVEFDRLKVGVKTDRSVVRINNNLFRRINTTGLFPLTDPYAGVWSIGDPGSTSLPAQARVEIGNTTGNNFRNCSFGVLARFHQELDVRNDTIRNTGTGALFWQMPQNSNVQAVGNLIRRVGTGLEALNSPNTTLLFSTNDIRNLDRGARRGCVIQNASLPGGAANQVIENNDIRNVNVAVYCSEAREPQVRFNTIRNAAPFFVTPGNPVPGFGVQLLGCVDAIVNDNDTRIGASFVPVVPNMTYGYDVQLSPNSDVFCNTANRTDFGIRCVSASPGTQLHDNTLRNNNECIRLDVMAIIGDQFKTSPSSPGTMFAQDNVFINVGSFKTFCNGTTQGPDFYHSGIGNADMSTGNGANGLDLSNPVVPILTSNILNTICGPFPLLAGLALHESNAQNLGTDTNTMLNKQATMNALLADSNYCLNSQVLASFLPATLNTPMGQLKQVSDSSIELGGCNNNTLALCNAIIPANNMDQNSKTVLQMMIANHVNGILNLTAAQISQLEHLADLCPFEDGLGVYQARALLRTAGDTVVHLNPCEISSINSNRMGRTSSEENTEPSREVISVKAYPNPSSDRVTFEVSSSSSGVLKVFNLQSQLIIERTLTESSTLTESFERFGSGMYHFQFVQNNQALVNGNFVIAE